MSDPAHAGESNGADGETRTLTRLLLHAPEACASTNSATSAVETILNKEQRMILTVLVI